MAFNWTCPYCSRHQTVTSANFALGKFGFAMVDSDLGPIGLSANAIICANPECKKATVTASIREAKWYNSRNSIYVDDNARSILTLQLMPDSFAKPQPDFIPPSLREDYAEACRIRDLSPKASATLSRRCLQGMIRDFCKISKGTLFEEINTLKALVDAAKAPAGVSLDSVEAIDHIRGVGNIGAHMEKDINHIVPVDPQEAQLLIELIESLFEEWYVAREKRASRFSEIKALADSKKELIANHKTPQIEGPKDEQGQ